MNAFDAGAVNFRDIGAVGERQCDDGVPGERHAADARNIARHNARQRQAESDQVERDNGGKAAKHITIERSKHADGPAGLARQEPRDGDDQAPDEDQDLGDDKDENVIPEGPDDQMIFIGNQRQI